MKAQWRGEVVTVYGTKGDRTQIGTRRGLRWVRTDELTPALVALIRAELGDATDYGDNDAVQRDLP